MKLLLFSPYYFPVIGGVEQLVALMAKTRMEQGWQVRVLTNQLFSDECKIQFVDGVELCSIPYQRLLAKNDLKGLERSIRFARDYLDHFDPDLIHAQGVFELDAFFLSRVVKGAYPLVISIHSLWDLNFCVNDNKMKLITMAKSVTVVSDSLKQEWENKIAPISQNLAQVTVIKNALPDVISDKLSRRSQSPTILMASRLEKQKNIEAGLYLIQSLLPRYPDLKLNIVGEGSCRRELEKGIDMLNLNDSVSLHPAVPPSEVRAWLESAWVLFFPSLYEAFPLILLQAARLKTPVLASRVGGTPEIIEDEKTGLLFDLSDKAACYKKMDRLLSSETLRNRLGSAAADAMNQHFTFDVMMQAYDKVYA